jgi:hypothetical protein
MKIHLAPKKKMLQKLFPHLKNYANGESSPRSSFARKGGSPT